MKITAEKEKTNDSNNNTGTKRQQSSPTKTTGGETQSHQKLPDM